MSKNYTEANSAKIAVVNINRIEKVDQNKMTNTGNMKLEGGLTFILYNAHFYSHNGERIRSRINIDFTYGRMKISKNVLSNKVNVTKLKKYPFISEQPKSRYSVKETQYLKLYSNGMIELI